MAISNNGRDMRKQKIARRREIGEIIAHAEGNRRIPLQTILLGTLYVGGVLGIALVAPNAVHLFEFLNPIARKNGVRFNQRVRQALGRLEQRGLIRVTSEGQTRTIELTKEGEALIDGLYAGSYVIPLPARWDGKWRLVMFDVPEVRKAIRDTLRMLLRNAGFVHFQDSAWIQPYPCDDLVTLLRSHLASSKGEIRYLVVQFIDESDYALRKHFNLVTF